MAQLRQLRGRVGRGAGCSSCPLLYKGPLGEAARARLEILPETEDGFRLAKLEIHGKMLALARRQAEAALAAGEGLRGEANKGLRLLIYLFERDETAKLMEAG